MREYATQIDRALVCCFQMHMNARVQNIGYTNKSFRGASALITFELDCDPAQPTSDRVTNSKTNFCMIPPWMLLADDIGDD